MTIVQCMPGISASTASHSVMWNQLSVVDMIYYLAALITVALFCFALLGNRPFRPLWLFAVASGIPLVLILVVRPIGPDIRTFHRAGQQFAAGLDPYASSPETVRGGLVVNPPTALPLYWLLSRFPIETTAAIWNLCIVFGGLLLVPLSCRVLFSSGAEDTSLPKPGMLIAVTAIVMLSNAMQQSFKGGQMTVWTSIWILVALWTRQRGCRIASGVCLGLATVKIATMLPFLLLLLRRSDIRIWVAFITTTAALCLTAGTPTQLIQYGGEILTNIHTMGQKGGMNDYSYGGPFHESIISLDHAFYRTGLLHDRRAIRMVQGIAIFAMGAWLFSEIFRGKVDFPAAAAIISLYAMLFLYHRLYDMVMLALPLTYATVTASRADPDVRCWFVAAAIAMISVMYMQTRFLKSLYHASLEWGFWGQMIRAVVLPYATWMILLALICLAIGARRSCIARKNVCLVES